MNEKELILLSQVKAKCAERPEFLQHIIQVGVDALIENERAMRHQAADMETFASAMVALVGEKRVSKAMKDQMNNLALSKLSKYYPKTFLNWGSDVKREG